MKSYNNSILFSKKILLLDDLPYSFDLISEIFLEEGAKVDLASSATIARSKLKNSDYDIFLTDFYLEDHGTMQDRENSLTLIKDIRSGLVSERKKLSKIPIVVLTADDRISTRIDVAKEDALLLIKSGSLEDLKRMCRLVLQSKIPQKTFGISAHRINNFLQEIEKLSIKEKVNTVDRWFQSEYQRISPVEVNILLVFIDSIQAASVSRTQNLK